MAWKTVGVVDNEHMNVPHVLQQQMFNDKHKSKHRLVSIYELNGVDDG